MTTSSSTSATAATNPLSVNHRLPPFSAIKPEHIKPAIEQRLNQNRERIRELLATVSEPTWDNFIAPMEAWDDELSQAWSPVGHLNGVLNSDELRDAYNACLPLLSQYSTEMGQNKALCDAYKKLRASAQAPHRKPPSNMRCAISIWPVSICRMIKKPAMAKSVSVCLS